MVKDASKAGFSGEIRERQIVCVPHLHLKALHRVSNWVPTRFNRARMQVIMLEGWGLYVFQVQ